MLFLEIQVNHLLIGQVHVFNKGRTGLDDKNNRLYKVQYKYHLDTKKPEVMNFEIVHNREEGVEKLILLVYQEINKRLS